MVKKSGFDDLNSLEEEFDELPFDDDGLISEELPPDEPDPNSEEGTLSPMEEDKPAEPAKPGRSGQVVDKIGKYIPKAGDTWKINLDVCVVMDCTGSMEHLIDMVKRNVLNFRSLVYDKLVEKMPGKRPDRVMNKLRVRVVAYRDYNYDWEAANPDERAMLSCPFYDLDDEADRDALKTFVDKLVAAGGEDLPESGLEALHYAINSEWDRDPGSKHRHVIMLFTDAPAIDLADPRNAVNPHYPNGDGIPKSLAELQAEYCDDKIIGTLDQRLYVFAPSINKPEDCMGLNDEMIPCINWSDVADWNGAQLLEMQTDGGMTEASLEMIITTLTGSLR